MGQVEINKDNDSYRSEKSPKNIIPNNNLECIKSNAIMELLIKYSVVSESYRPLLLDLPQPRFTSGIKTGIDIIVGLFPNRTELNSQKIEKIGGRFNEFPPSFLLNSAYSSEFKEEIKKDFG